MKGIFAFVYRSVLYAAYLVPLFSYSQKVIEFRRITNVQDSYPMISPDGRNIVFQSNRTGNAEIFITTIKGDSLRQLTFNPSDDVCPVWSPDGKKILFVSERDGNSEIYTMRSDGTYQTRLTNFPGDDNHPHWTPDGQEITFNSARTTQNINVPWSQQVHEIFIMRADGSHVRQLSFLKGIATNPSLSPDGHKVLFRRITNDKGFNWNLAASMRNSEIYVMNKDGGNLLNLSNCTAYDTWPCWSPDGSKIIFSSNRDSVKNTGQIFIVNPDGSGLRRVTDGPNSFVRATWSPDGTMIVAQQVWGTDESNGNLVLLEVGEKLKQMLNSKVVFRKITGGDIVTDGGLSRGVSTVDFNNDGMHDITVGNHGQQSLLYRNAGNNQFKKMIGEGDPAVFDKTEGISWADVDNDNDLDLFVTNIMKSGNLLFQNDSNLRFKKVVAGDLTNDTSSSTAACWCDVDKDGDLDVFVVNRDEQDDRLYVNNGKGYFKSLPGPWVGNKGDGRACAWADVDADGWADLYIGNYMKTEAGQPKKERNFFYLNQGKSTFKEINSGEFVQMPSLTYGVSFVDFDNDGDPDLLTTNVSRSDHNILFSNDGRGNFTPLQNSISTESFHPSKGHTWADFDNNGYQDLFIVTGTENVPDNTLENLLYLNNGNGVFEKITTGTIVTEPDISAGTAWLDYDRDGKADLFVSNWGGGDENNSLFRNETPDNNWVSFRFRGKSNNSFGVGVKVSITYKGEQGSDLHQHQWLYNSTGYSSQNPFELHFGVGKAAAIERAEILWPNGMRQVMLALNANRLYTILESESNF